MSSPVHSLWLLSLLCCLPAVTSLLTVSNTISSHAVLQAGKPLTSLWGFATPGSTITTTFAAFPSPPNVPLSTTGTDGIFRVSIPPLPITNTPFNLTLTGDGSSVTLFDLLVGHVLLCSGQSNLQLSIQMAQNATAEIAALDSYGATVRILYTAGESSPTPLVDLPAPQLPWQRMSSLAGRDGWSGFSATCWYTGRSLWATLGSGATPIGLAESAVGGTAIRQWSPVQALALCPQPYNSPNPYGTGPYQHSTLYNAQVAPFGTGPTVFSAVLYDQAESDSFPQTPLQYFGCAGSALINSWRTLLQAPTIPFTFEHLQPYGQDSLEVLRASQLEALSLPFTGYATAIDLGDPTSPIGAVHFRNKQAVGARHALAIRALWGGDATATAVYPPSTFLSQTTFFTNATTPGGLATYLVNVSFFRLGLTPGTYDATPLPLTLATNVTCLAPPCAGFTVLGSDGNAYPGNATLTGDGLGVLIVAQGPANVYPVGSQNAWGEWPLVTLYSAGGLPVLPWNQNLIMAGPPPPPPTLA